MKKKNKIIALFVSLSFCIVALFNVIYFRDNGVGTHEVFLQKNTLDYMSMLEEFDEKELIVEGNDVKVEAVQYLDSDFFNVIDNMSMEKLSTKGSMTYDIEYDGDNNVFILKTISKDIYGNENIVRTEGAAFINEYGEIDAVFVDEEGNVLLSELVGGTINNCGFFSRLKKALKVIAVVAAVVAVAAVVVAAVAACPAVGVLVTTTGETVLATTGTIGSAALIGGALTTAAVAGTAALTTYGLSQLVYDSYVGTAELTYQQTTYKPLVETIIGILTGTYTLTASRDYKIAYVQMV